MVQHAGEEGGDSDEETSEQLKERVSDVQKRGVATRAKRRLHMEYEDEPDPSQRRSQKSPAKKKRLESVQEETESVRART